MKYPEMTEYISIEDATKVQILCKKLFENFDGGFCGDLENSHLLHQPINDKNIDFGFLTDTPDSQDIAFYTWKPNQLKIENYHPYIKTIRYSLFEVLFEICKILGVSFSPTKNCIDECFKAIN